MRKIVLIALLLGMVTDAIVCQVSYRTPSQRQMFNRQGRNAFTIDFGVAGAAYLFEGNIQATRPGLGTHLQLGYTIFRDRSLGLYIGLGAVYSYCGFADDNIERQTLGLIDAYTNDNNNNTAWATRTSHFSTLTTSVKEHYHSIFAEVPLQAAIRNDHFWMNIGVKALLPLNIDAPYDYGETSIGVGTEIDGFGTSVPIPIEVSSLPKAKGSYHVADAFAGEVCYPFYVLFALSGGYRWATDENKIFHIGFYLDVALNHTPLGGSDGMVDLNSTPYHYSTVLGSNMASAMRYVSAGITFSYNLSFGRKITYNTLYDRSRYYKEVNSRRTNRFSNSRRR